MTRKLQFGDACLLTGRKFFAAQPQPASTHYIYASLQQTDATFEHARQASQSRA